MNIRDLVKGPHKAILNEFTEDEAVNIVKHLLENNSKEALALMYLELVGREGWEFGALEEAGATLEEYIQSPLPNKKPSNQE